MPHSKDPSYAKNWVLAKVHVSKVMEALAPIAEYDASKVVPFPPRPRPAGDTPVERMLSVAGQKIR